jgi:hypothetical protein
LIAGFVIGGRTSQTILIRAAGPSLATFGIRDALPDPRIELFRGTTSVAVNDDWGGEPQVAAISAAIGAFAFSGPNSKDAALLTTLAPGAYTVVVRGAGAGGVALVEVYEIP